MATRGKQRVVGPFEAVTPPDMGEDEKAAREVKPVPPEPTTPSPEAQKKLEEMDRDRRERKKMDRAYERSRSNPDFAKGGKVSSASKRADGCAMRGKTKGRMV